jgi:acyl-CoA thioester hydrolase
MRGKVLRFRHELLNTETDAICATCDFTVVCLDPQSRKSQLFPTEVALRANELILPPPA